MASTQSWVDALNIYRKVEYTSISTPLTYSRIKELGLKTVRWETFYSESKEKIIESSRGFIDKYGSSLFIWDPKRLDKRLKKGFLFGVKDYKKIHQLFLKRPSIIENYDFLITTLISGVNEGFVGSLHSDGNGRILCETLHIPKVCLHPELSRSVKPSNKNLDFFVADEWSFRRGKIPRLGLRRAKGLIKEFSDKKGYFEFSYGSHLGKVGVYSIGLEDGELFRFPDLLHESILVGNVT